MSDANRAKEDRAIYRALKYIEARAKVPGTMLSQPETAINMFRLSLACEEREHFEVAFLDTKNRLIARERLFSGTIDRSAVHVRIVVQRAMQLNASACIVAHNHPSGVVDPSQSDRRVTDDLAMALQLVEVQLLDHIIVSPVNSFSFANNGLL